MSRQEPFFRVDVTSGDEGSTLTLHGELDLLTGPQLELLMAEVLADHPRLIVLDLGSLGFIDSAGAEAIDHALDCCPAGCQVVLRHPKLLASVVLESVGLNRRCVIETCAERGGPRVGVATPGHPESRGCHHEARKASSSLVPARLRWYSRSPFGTPPTASDDIGFNVDWQIDNP